MKMNFMNNNFICIAIGAVPAAILRWQIDNIFFVNIIGCFILGFINALSINRKLKLIFAFGFCGSLTTFSGWSFQLLNLLNQGFYKLFFFHSIILVLISFLAICLGHLCGKNLV